MSTRHPLAFSQSDSINTAYDLDRQHALQTALQALLSGTQAAQHITPEQVVWLDHTVSSNDDVKQRLQPNSMQPVIVATNTQQAGRGQSGRIWQSPRGNLYVSCGVRLHSPIQGRLALEVALAVLRMPILAHIAGLAVKWPNDLHHQSKHQAHNTLNSSVHSHKWGGILIEPIGTHQVVIGMGMNLQPTVLADQPTQDLNTLSAHTIDVVPLAAHAVQAVLAACACFDAGSPNLVERFAQYDGLAGHAIRLQQPHTPDVLGVARGITGDGALCVSTAQGLAHYYSGHVRALGHAQKPDINHQDHHHTQGQ